ncbi:MAG: family 10 glycosylhydrolase [Planctomycetes bacterium]|nr:family 10 glycosylhydrolase [Planctomycetota bacterium]
MRKYDFALFGCFLLALPAFCQDGVLELKGMGAEGKKVYQGGKVEFLDVSLADEIVHFESPEKIPLRLSIRYRVLKTAPVFLNSRLGTEFWRLYHYGKGLKGGFYTREQIDLSKEGEATAEVGEVRLATGRGEAFSKGLQGIRGHYYFLVDQPDGKWLDVVKPPAFFYRPELNRKLAFTIANLSKFSVRVSDIESTWQSGGPVRVKFTVTDADGETFPVVNAKAAIESGKWKAPLVTEMDDLNMPTGWMAAKLPTGNMPGQVVVRASFNAMTPNGPAVTSAERSFQRGEGKKALAEMAGAAKPVELPRNAKGIIRETRALWLNPGSFMTKKDIETVVARANEAGLNMIVADIFVRSFFMAKSDLFPTRNNIEEGLDPLGYLIAKAHEKGIEVHPWFCVTYRDPNFRKRLPGVDVVKKDGTVAKLPADVHRPEYRDFIVNLMVGVARDYDVDGIHLDYIRAMDKCYCKKCRTEFQEKFGKPITEATKDDWVTWQREAIGDIVRRTAEGVKAAKPKAIMSAAVFSNMEGGAEQGQDPAGWARKGWIDVVIPMDYQMDTLVVRANEQQFLNALDNDDQLVTGLSLYMRSGTAALNRAPSLVKQQIQVVRRLGIHGYCLFEYQYLGDETIKMMKTETNTERAVPYFRNTK